MENRVEKLREHDSVHRPASKNMRRDSGGGGGLTRFSMVPQDSEIRMWFGGDIFAGSMYVRQRESDLL